MTSRRTGTVYVLSTKLLDCDFMSWNTKMLKTFFDRVILRNYQTYWFWWTVMFSLKRVRVIGYARVLHSLWNARTRNTRRITIEYLRFFKSKIYTCPLNFVLLHVPSTFITLYLCFYCTIITKYYQLILMAKRNKFVENNAGSISKK